MDRVSGDVFFNHVRAGILEREKGVFRFTYDPTYLKDQNSVPISYSFPLREQPYEATDLFPFFAGLVSEGWLLRMQSQSQKIDERDYLGLLVQNGEDLIGAVKVMPRKMK